MGHLVSNWRGPKARSALAARAWPRASQLGPQSALKGLTILTLLIVAALFLLTPARCWSSCWCWLGVLLAYPLTLFPTASLVGAVWLSRPSIMHVLSGQRRLNTPTFANTPLSAHPDSVDLRLGVTVQVPVYTESFTVLRTTLDRAGEAIELYNTASPVGANLVVSDDALMVWADNDLDGFVRQAVAKPAAERTATEHKVLERIEYYRTHRLGFVARPKPMPGLPATQRRGLFKKGSNLNHTLRLSEAVKKLQKIKGIDTETALRQVWALPAYAYTHAEGDIRIRELILLLDKDSLTPREALVLTVPEFVRDPTLAYTQHKAHPSNAEANYFSRITGCFTRVLYELSIPAKVLQGAMVPFMGHNGFIRTAALSALGGWHEGRVAEDFDFALQVNARGYHGKYITSPDQAFGEQVTRTYTEEAGKYRRYAFGMVEMVFHPLAAWGAQGLFAQGIKTFWKSPYVPWYQAVDLVIYKLSYVNLVSLLPLWTCSVFALASPAFLEGVAILLVCNLIPLAVVLWFSRHVPLSDNGWKTANWAALCGRLVLAGLVIVTQWLAVLQGFAAFFSGMRPTFPATRVEDYAQRTIPQLLSEAAVTRFEIVGLGALFMGLLMIASVTHALTWHLVLAAHPLLLRLILPYLMHPPLMTAVWGRLCSTWARTTNGLRAWLNRWY